MAKAQIPATSTPAERVKAYKTYIGSLPDRQKAALAALAAEEKKTKGKPGYSTIQTDLAKANEVSSKRVNAYKTYIGSLPDRQKAALAAEEKKVEG